MNNKYMSAKFISMLLCAALLTSCTSTRTQTGNPTATTEASASSDVKPSSPVTSDMITYDADDTYTNWENQNPNYIELKGNTATVKGSGATVSNSKVTITKAGVYILSGNLDNGQIIVDENNNGTVRLVLYGANITSSDSSAIYVKNAGKAIVSLPEGTQNTISDSKKYSDTGDDAPTAAIFSKDNLTINGTGALTVNGNYKDGITSKDDLKITAGNIKLTATDDGLVGRDMILIKDGNFDIKAGGDGIKSTNDTDAKKGFIAIENGTFNITSGNDAIQAENSILLKDGVYKIVSGGGSVNGTKKPEQNGPMQGNMNKNTTTATTTSTETEKESKKGIKATSDITISGGKYTFDTSDDSIHSNNSVSVAGGDFNITSGDDGIHSDTTLTISDGNINIAKSYEGIESSIINISGGTTKLIASDDGVNVAGGSDSSSQQGRPGQNTFSSSGNNKLNITGGYLSVDATGDGLDANGSIAMSGGTVLVSGPTANNNGAVDYDGTFEVTGGTLIAAGSSGMAQGPSDQSTQYSIVMSFTQTQQAGTIIAVKDSSGKTIAAFSPKKQYQTVVITSPELRKDSTYTIYSGGTTTATSADGYYSNGQYTGGNKIVDFTLSSSVTWLNESGVTTAKSGMPGGGIGFRDGNTGGQPPEGMNPGQQGTGTSKQ